MEQTADKTKRPRTSFYGCFKREEDIAGVENIDDLKIPVYRAIPYKGDEHESISRLCQGAFRDGAQPAEGQWIIEEPRMVEGRIRYTFMDDKEFRERFRKYDASGILGCGKGSERFTSQA